MTAPNLYLRPERSRRERLTEWLGVRRQRAGMHRATRAGAKAAAREAQADDRAYPVLPHRGASRPHAGQAPVGLRVPAHHATSAVLQAAYPFLAEPGLGSRGMYVGLDCCTRASFVYDPFVLYRQGVLTNPNMLLMGVLGAGKSTLAKTLALRAVAFGRRVYVPGDPKGEWGAVARAVGGTVIPLGRGLPNRLNPLDAGTRPSHLSVDEWASELAGRRRDLLAALAEVGLHRRLDAVERTALDLALREVCRADASPARRPAPTLADLVGALLSPTPGAAITVGMTDKDLAVQSRSLTLELRRLVDGDLAGLFDGPTTIGLDFAAPMAVLDLSRIQGSDELIALVMTCASAWLEQVIVDPAAGQRYIVYDEAWRLMRLLPLVRRMQTNWKLARAYGIANLVITHRLSDLSAVGDEGSEAVAIARGLLADAATRIVYQQEPDQIDATASLLGLTDVEAATVPTLLKGRGLWKVARHSYLVHNVVSAAEQALTDTDQRMR